MIKTEAEKKEEEKSTYLVIATVMIILVLVGVGIFLINKIGVDNILNTITKFDKVSGIH